ncbi:hypothetical protein J2X19_000895 [Rhodoferax ferrireducens]|uniref:Uncharacterized protein n=1 Tax=Rhodoferax ferrireducens TaxID=192843 RepID=A0ABU2C4H7_9BURK|nr:hypothetical protein [Rhodoferax ferrireducens]MDR7376237.1 hypothetical protein [Rhodoferax ferrireducens]
MPTRTRKPTPAVQPAVKSVDTSAPRRKGSAPDSPPPDTHPKLPHERDQSVEATDGTPSVEVEQAYRDVSRGLQDTDRGPEADRTYKKLQR